MGVIETYIYRYPQLTLPIKDGMSTSESYKNIALRGKLPAKLESPFLGTAEDAVFSVETPVGAAEVLYLADRRDFERCVQALAYKCEPRVLPASMGAIHVSGVNNWRKIQAHKKRWLTEGGEDWRAEFKRFTADPKNYKDTIIIVSKGAYSGLPAAEAGYPAEEWLRLSLEIRIYHELTHFVCRRLYPEKKDALWDEIVADCMGIYKATSDYDAVLAAKLLGVEEDMYRLGGRLENYVEEGNSPQAYCSLAKETIRRLARIIAESEDSGFWEVLEKIYASNVNDRPIFAGDH